MQKFDPEQTKALVVKEPSLTDQALSRRDYTLRYEIGAHARVHSGSRAVTIHTPKNKRPTGDMILAQTAAYQPKQPKGAALN